MSERLISALMPVRIRNIISSLVLGLLYSRENNIPTHLTVGEKRLLMNLAKRCLGTTYVEIGSYYGASSCFIARGVEGSQTGGRLFCVDTWMNDAMTEGNRDTYQQFRNNTLPYGGIITPLRNRSSEAAELVHTEVNFLFVDGDHSYQGVVTDIQAWFPKLSRDALVIFHDYSWAEGVQKAVNEFVKPIERSPGGLVDNAYWAVVRPC